MSTLKEIRNSALTGNKNVVTEPHSRWLQTPEDQQTYSEEAIAFVGAVLRREFKHARPGRFSPSAMGECPRRILLGFAGADQQQPAIDNQEMMDHGSWTHLKWQAEGLTMGYMTEAEAWVHNEDLLCGGSMDAVLHDGSIFELKSAGWSIYRDIVVVDTWPKWNNLLQLHTYYILFDALWGSLVMENRSGGQFHEFRVPRDAKIEAEVLRRLSSYKAYAEEDDLPPVLTDCAKRRGDVYKRCPYRDICLEARSVSEFGHVK